MPASRRAARRARCPDERAASRSAESLRLRIVRRPPSRSAALRLGFGFGFGFASPRCADSSSGRRRRGRPSAPAPSLPRSRARRRGRRRRCPRRRGLELHGRRPRPRRSAAASSARALAAKRAARSSASVDATTVAASSSNRTAASICEEISVRFVERCLRLRHRRERLASRANARACSASSSRDRGTHLAAMIAYFALLSFVPLLFLALALLGLRGPRRRVELPRHRAEQGVPVESVDGILKVVRSIQDNATTLGIDRRPSSSRWTSLSLFSVLESAFNIVYGKPNRSFLHGKLVAVMLLVGSLVTLFFGLLIGSVGYEVLKRFAGSFFGNDYVAYAAVDVDLDRRRLRLPLLRLLPADEREAHVPGSAARRDRRDDRARGELPAPADLPPPLEERDRAAGLRRAGAAARLALPDGERDRLRGRGQLVPDARPPRSGRARRSPGLA